MKYLTQRYSKAIQGAVGAGVLALAVAFLFGPSQWNVTQGEWQAILAAVVGGAGLPAVGKANAPKRARHNQRGAVDLTLVLVLVVLVILVLFLAGALHR